MRLLFVPLLMLFVAPAAAHRGHDAMTVVTVAKDGVVRVSHRFAAHDIEPALVAIAPHAQANLDDPDAIKALLVYLSLRFMLASEHGAIALAPGRTEIDSDEVRIAFSGKAHKPIARLAITNQILLDVHPEQVAQVDVRYGKTRRTLVFRGGGSQTVAISKLAQR